MNRKVEAGKPLTTQPSITLEELMDTFRDEAACKTLLRDLRWPDGVRCPRCNNAHVYTLRFKDFHWVCKVCGGRNGYRFSVLSKTIFENTNYPLSTWFQVIYLMTQSKKGISALQIHRQIGSGDYRTAWYMCQRVRAAMKDEGLAKLLRQVEVDETFIGGKDKNRHEHKKRHIRGTGDKIPVIGAISRKGSIVCKMIERADVKTLHSFVHQVVDKDNVSLVATDEASGYQYLKPWQGLPPEVVNHRSGEYVRGEVHTNNMESFWSLLKRGILGTYHQVSKKYLPLYLAEFQYRFNNRKNPNIFFDVVAGC